MGAEFDVNDSANWRLDDPRPGVPLAAISNAVDRARALFARSRETEILRNHYLQVAGTIDTLDALEYHHTRFMTVVAQLAAGSVYNSAPLRYEASAYITRVGQFVYFCRSELVTRRLGDVRSTTPKIDALLTFRHKVTAHRAIDAPRPDDTPWLQTVHAMALNGGTHFVPRPGSARPSDELPFQEHLRLMWSTHFVKYQTHTDEQVCEFTPELDHPTILAEAYSVLERLIAASATPPPTRGDAPSGAATESPSALPGPER